MDALVHRGGPHLSLALAALKNTSNVAPCALGKESFEKWDTIKLIANGDVWRGEGLIVR